MAAESLRRPVASAAVESTGWRLLLYVLAASVEVQSLHEALEIAGAATAAAGDDADDHLQVDLRPDRVELLVYDRTHRCVTPRDVQIVEEITAAVHGLGHAIAPPSGERPVQRLEIAIDTLDRAAIRPFWLAVLGYEDEFPDDPNGIVDPAGIMPAVWFQQLDKARPQRNRIHFDITVSHDEAQRRIQAAVEAGGHVVSDEHVKAFWVLADADGNEVCVCTWQDRERPN